ncbi:MAG: threonine synthase [Kiritimatiellae bacterium]|nr:threonine synthase [Kiritimatiellia bacterium]
MRYVSTRGDGEPLSFQQVVLAGLARDGGLYLPETIPSVTDKISEWRKLRYQDLAVEVMSLFADDIPIDELRKIVEKSYAVFRDEAVAPLRQVGPLFIMELFHGPTLAFKDVAMQFLGNLFEYVLAENHAEMNIVAATSGDTGSAAINGMRGRKGIRTFVMFPFGRVSPVQERQMTTVLDDNVFTLSVHGTFDDCQNIVKTLFNDLPFRDACKLGAVNSINWARIVAQVVYYFYAALQLQNLGYDQTDITVPTGNFGNIFAGYLAKKMGAPIRHLVLATNENDILYRYFQTGIYSTGTVMPTISPSMDIQVASNFERYLYYLADEDGATVKRWMESFRETGKLQPDRSPDPLFRTGRADTQQTLDTIRDFWKEYHYLLDPHTAVGVSVSLRTKEEGAPILALATAHPAKFGSAIQRATGEDLAHHPILDALMELPTRVREMPSDARTVGEYIQSIVK